MVAKVLLNGRTVIISPTVIGPLSIDARIPPPFCSAMITFLPVNVLDFSSIPSVIKFPRTVSFLRTLGCVSSPFVRGLSNAIGVDTPISACATLFTCALNGANTSVASVSGVWEPIAIKRPLLSVTTPFLLKVTSNTPKLLLALPVCTMTVGVSSLSTITGFSNVVWL